MGVIVKSEDDRVKGRLRVWGRVWRDRSTRGRAMSAEGYYRSPQRDHHEPIPGDPEPKPLLRPDVREAYATWLMIRDVLASEIGPNLKYRALTWWYCWMVRPGYSGIPMHIALRKLSQRAGFSVNEKKYVELVTTAEQDLAPVVYKYPALTYINARHSLDKLRLPVPTEQLPW